MPAVHEETEAAEGGDATHCGMDSGSEDEIEIEADGQWLWSSVFLRKKESMPRTKKRAAVEREDESEDGEDFVVLNAHKTSKQDRCPLTLQKIEKPVRNMLCRHIYERRAIINYKHYLTKNKRPQTCPQGGCQAPLVVSC